MTDMTLPTLNGLDLTLIIIALVAATVMLTPGIRNLPCWRATVTPLASIIGSGFLVVVPLLANITGPYSVLAMGGIVLLSFWLGHAIRFNILHDSKCLPPNSRPLANGIERLSDITLAVAYVISITFYIRLLAGFVLTGIGYYSTTKANLLSTAILLFIGVYGLTRGLRGLEKLETFSVTLKLAIIVSLLTGLVHYDLLQGYDLTPLHSANQPWFATLCQLGGMLLIVQGFETSKYLGVSYSPQTKARSMLIAQLLAGVIYVTFVALAMPLMSSFNGSPADETAIIHLSSHITLALPAMLVFAAVMSQFSAAVADTIGAGGVVENESRGKLSAYRAYLVITIMGCGLLWVSNVFELVSLASRAFAFFYMLQALAALVTTARTAEIRCRYVKIANYLALSLLLLAIVIFAKPVAV